MAPPRNPHRPDRLGQGAAPETRVRRSWLHGDLTPKQARQRNTPAGDAPAYATPAGARKAVRVEGRPPLDGETPLFRSERRRRHTRFGLAPGQTGLAGGQGLVQAAQRRQVRSGDEAVRIAGTGGPRQAQ